MSHTHPSTEPRPSVAERQSKGRERRQEVPRTSHSEWSRADDGPDPVALIERQNTSRVPWLVPIRRHRMIESPFAFFRGTAGIMAADLASTPSSGFTVQLCGDAHLANFGAYASPERNLVFDVNDFDETLPGPWEWDIKRLATSVGIAAQDREFNDAVIERTTKAAVIGYQEAMAEFAEHGYLENWYAHLAIPEIAQLLSKKKRGKLQRVSAKARGRTNQQALRKFAEKVDDNYRIKSDPPTLIPLRDLDESTEDPEALREGVLSSLDGYVESLPDSRRHLFSQYRLIDIAVKVVGVGSVGTRCLIALFIGRDDSDPLFLQVKEADRSVLEAHLPASRYDEPGRRVVEGQHLTQAASDIFLGWSRNNSTGVSHYWRQLRDWKGSVNLTKLGPTQLGQYARVCGWTLAHAHARSGDPITISGYLGSGPSFARAISEFAVAYSRQNEADYLSYRSAIVARNLEVAAE